MFTRRWPQRHTPRGLSWVPAPCALQERVQLPPPRSPRCAVAAGQQGPWLLSRSSPWPQRPGPARSRELPPRHGAFAPTLPCECRARGHRVSSVLHRAADLCGLPWPLAVCPAPRPRGRHRRAMGRCACRIVGAQCRGRGDLPPPCLLCRGFGTLRLAAGEARRRACSSNGDFFLLCSQTQQMWPPLVRGHYSA